MIQKGFNIMNEQDEQQKSSVWGLNFLQNPKDSDEEITGAYDPKQELWTTLEQVQGGAGLGQLPKDGLRLAKKDPTYFMVRTPGRGADVAKD
jgi:hypothetical protein